MMSRSQFGRLLGFALFALVPSSAAWAHAIVLESVPGVDAAVAGPDLDVAVRFNSRIDLHRSRLTLMLPGGGSRVLAIREDAGPANLEARATGLAPGAYTLRWQVLAADGHITRGDIPFTVVQP